MQPGPNAPTLNAARAECSNAVTFTFGLYAVPCRLNAARAECSNAECVGRKQENLFFREENNYFFIEDRTLNAIKEH
jgi:hypothetical protein